MIAFCNSKLRPRAVAWLTVQAKASPSRHAFPRPVQSDYLVSGTAGRLQLLLGRARYDAGNEQCATLPDLHCSSLYYFSLLPPLGCQLARRRSARASPFPGDRTCQRLKPRVRCRTDASRRRAQVNPTSSVRPKSVNRQLRSHLVVRPLSTASVTPSPRRRRKMSCRSISSPGCFKALAAVVQAANADPPGHRISVAERLHHPSYVKPPPQLFR